VQNAIGWWSVTFFGYLTYFTAAFNKVHISPGKSLINFSKISMTRKVLENEIGRGKCWKLKCGVVEIPGRA